MRRIFGTCCPPLVVVVPMGANAPLAPGWSPHNCASSDRRSRRSSCLFPEGIVFGRQPGKGICPSVWLLRARHALWLAVLVPGRPLRNYASAKFPPISQKGILFSERPDKGLAEAYSCEVVHTPYPAPPTFANRGQGRQKTKRFQSLTRTIPCITVLTECHDTQLHPHR